MDLTFKTENGIFNYRVCAIIKHKNKLLATKNANTPYYFLPGGRVNLHEDAETALRRELREELGINASIVRPLWFNQNFFIEDVTLEKYHELCVYFLVDVSDTYLINQEKIIGLETRNNEIFEWVNIEELPNLYLYPLFIKQNINDLPQHFEILTEYEY